MAKGSEKVSENPFAQHSVKSLTKYRITDLLRELFSIVVKKHLSKDTTLAASNSDANTPAGPPAISPAPVKVEEVESHVGALTGQRHADYDAAQLAIRYATISVEDWAFQLFDTNIRLMLNGLCSKDTEILFNPFHPIKNEPAPLIASSEKKLIDMLTTWTKEHPGSTLEGVRKLSGGDTRQQLDQSRAQPILVACSRETFQLNRFQINERLYGWILKRIDGSCMFVKVRVINGKTIMYQIWLGGDDGFTSDISGHRKKPLLGRIHSQNIDETTTEQDDTDSSNSDGKLFQISKRLRCFRISRRKSEALAVHRKSGFASSS